MKRDQKKAQRKAARFERSRAERHWDGKEVVDRVFPVGMETTAHRAPPMPSSNIGDLIAGYLRAMGVPLPMLDVSNQERIKDAVVIDNENVRIELRDNGDGTGTNIITPKRPAEMVNLDDAVYQTLVNNKTEPLKGLPL